MPGTNQRYDLADWIYDADTAIIIKLWYQALIGQGTPPTGGGLPVSSSPTTVAPNFQPPVTAGQTVVIPPGAINSSVIILTGTGTLNGVDQPVGVPWTEPNKLGAPVTLVLGSPGTARVYYGT